MAKNQTYRAFVARPSHVLDLDGELLDGARILANLASEVRDISSYATYLVRNDEALGDELERVTAPAPDEAGRQAGVSMPDFLASGRTGRSRKERLVRYNVVTSYRSWQERIKAVNGGSSKYVSQGWKRTANGSAPSYGGDYVNLCAVDSAYACIENDPFTDGEIILKMVIRGAWYRLVFDFDNARFPYGRVARPLIRVQGNQPIFSFMVVTDNPIVQFSGDWVIGVDVGLNDYVTVVVRDTKTGRIVHETTLSRRVHSLWNNAVVAVEDLSWVSNTMQNGRWNRGEFVKWLTHYISQNGGWVVAVNASNTSQVCHLCGADVEHPIHKSSSCLEHGMMDRDVNAAANIAARAIPHVTKARVTRAKNRRLQPQTALRTPPARASLKYPGRDRTKNRPTPKRKSHHQVSREVILPSCPARAQAPRLEASVLADQGAHGTQGTSKAAFKQGSVAHRSVLWSLI